MDKPVEIVQNFDLSTGEPGSDHFRGCKILYIYLNIPDIPGKLPFYPELRCLKQDFFAGICRGKSLKN